MRINFQENSIHSPETKIKDLLLQQYSKIHINSNITELFKDDMPFLHELIVTNVEIAAVIDNPNLDNIVTLLENLKGTMMSVAKHLRKFQRATQTATPRNIFLNQVHNAYGIFILELNAIIQKEKVRLDNNIITESSFERLINSPYIRPRKEPKTPNNTPETSCCWGTASSKTHPL